MNNDALVIGSMSTSTANGPSEYTRYEVCKADELLDEHPPSAVAEKMNMPSPTLWYWIKKGWVTNPGHLGGTNYDEKTIERADRLYDHMPLRAVSNVLDVPRSTLSDWKKKGWIDTQKNWTSEALKRTERTKRRAKRAAHLVYEQGLLQKEAAEEMGIAESTISKYLKKYRSGNITE